MTTQAEVERLRALIDAPRGQWRDGIPGPLADALEHAPHPPYVRQRPAGFYLTLGRWGRTAFLQGPYPSPGEAEQRVEVARLVAEQAGAWHVIEGFGVHQVSRGGAVTLVSGGAQCGCGGHREAVAR